MSMNIQESLGKQLNVATRIVETLVLRANSGAVFTVEVGENLLQTASQKFGAKVTLLAETPIHLTVLQGNSLEEILESAQEFIVNCIDENAKKQEAA